MRQERKILRADSEALARILREAFRSGKDRVSVPWFERSLELERVSDEEFVVRQSGIAATGRVVLGVGARPSGYPAGLPWVPDEIVMLGPPVGNTMVTWWSTGDDAALFAEIERQCVAAGWTRSAGAPPTPEEATVHLYEKASMRRHLMLSQGIVSLIEEG